MNWWRFKRKIKRWCADPKMGFKELLEKFKRNFAISFLGWREAEKDYPELFQVCRVYGSNRLWIYIEPESEKFPDFADTEEKKRNWYQFQDSDECYLNAMFTLWKPCKTFKKIR